MILMYLNVKFILINQNFDKYPSKFILILGIILNNLNIRENKLNLIMNFKIRFITNKFNNLYKLLTSIFLITNIKFDQIYYYH